jgi:hypothetical protein
MGGVAAQEAAQIARASFKSNTKLMRLKHFDAKHPPLNLRKARSSWQASFADGTHVYVDEANGEVLAIRTRQWRIYDWMWGLHIMDLKTREETSHPLLIAFAALTAISIALALILLPLATRWKRRR